MKVQVPGPGTLTAEDSRAAPHSRASSKPKSKHKALIKPANVSASSARKVILKLKLSSAGKTALKKKGKVPVTVLLTHKPTGGTAKAKTVKVTFRKSKKKHQPAPTGLPMQ